MDDGLTALSTEVAADSLRNTAPDTRRRLSIRMGGRRQSVVLHSLQKVAGVRRRLSIA